MTPSEIQLERSIIIQTRLGILCGNAEPTIGQMEIAIKEADEWEKKITAENSVGMISKTELASNEFSCDQRSAAEK